MPTDKKIRLVEELSETLSRCSVVVATDFSGMSVKNMTGLRHHLREHGIEYRVVKNTLTQRAADATNRAAVKEMLEGPIGFAFGYDDPVKPVKILVEYVRANRIPLMVRAAFLDGVVYKGQAINVLATLPSHQELVAQLIGQLSSPLFRVTTVLNRPLYGLVSTLNSPLAGLVNVLSQRVAQQSN